MFKNQRRVELGLHHSRGLSGGSLCQRKCGNARRRLGGEGDSEFIEKDFDVGLRLGIARQDEPSAVDHGYVDGNHLDGGELLHHRQGSEARGMNHEPVFECDLEAVSQEGNQDMGVDAVLQLVVDGGEYPVRFSDSETRILFASVGHSVSRAGRDLRR